MLVRNHGLSSIRISYFEVVTQKTPTRSLLLGQIAGLIAQPESSNHALKISNFTEKVRELKSKGKEKLAQQFKKQLPCVTFAAEFQNQRRKNAPRTENGLGLFDFDHLTKEEIQEVLEKSRQLPYVVMAWRSVSDEGVHIVASFPDEGSFEQNFPFVFEQIKHDFSFVADKLDKACSDVSRQCFLNTDKDLFCNWEATNIEISDEVRNKVTSPVGKEEKTHRRGVASVDTARTRIIGLRGWFDRKKEEKAGGSTPALVAALAGICNSWGIPYEEAYTETWELYGTECGVTKQKFQDTFAYIYRRYEDQYGSKKDEPHSKKGYEGYEATQIREDDIELPLFPPTVYDNLPVLFKDMMEIEKLRPHEKDAALLALLPLIASTLSATKVYEGKKIYPAIYSVIVGKPASGKGVAMSVQFLSKTWEKFMNTHFSSEEKVHSFRIGGNVTLAAMVEQLRDNGRFPLLMVDSEMNAMAVANKNRDTGDFDFVLNKAYEGECIQRDTKIAGHVVVDNPKLSMLLTGTPEQFFNAFQTNENGLASRLLGYRMPPHVVYKPLLCVSELDPEQEQKITALQQRFEAIASAQLYSEMETVWALTKEQTDELNKLMCEQLEECSGLVWEGSSLIRMRAKVIRVAAILAVVRMYDEQNYPAISPTGELFIGDMDFRTAYDIVCSSLEHTITLQGILNVPDRRPKMQPRPDWRDKFYTQKLPDSFKYTQGLDLCIAYGKKKATWKKALIYWQEKGLLQKQEDGTWVKVKQPADSSSSDE